jgi:glucose/arabinose dehydrogenase
MRRRNRIVIRSEALESRWALSASAPLGPYCAAEQPIAVELAEPITDPAAETVAMTAPEPGVPPKVDPIPYRAARGFIVETFAEDFQLPTNIAFPPNPGPNQSDPYFYVTELYGTIKVVTRDGTVSDFATGLLNFNPTGDFPGSGEQGLTGIAVDPETGDVFASMLYSTNPANDFAPHYPKVVRFTSTDGGRTAATQTTILDMVGEAQGQSHQISNVSFGPDGKLYVHMGDGFESSTAQNLNSFRGKILRMNTDGTAPDDNPFYNGAPITARDYVYARGFRNPFGGAWRASDGFHYEVENGPSVDRLVRVEEGENYEWDGSNASMFLHALYNWNPAAAPVNITFVQPETFDGSQFPSDKFDHAFVTESGSTYATGPSPSKELVEFVFDEEGDVVGGPRLLARYTGSGKGSFSALAAGPDGLYFAELYKDTDASTPIDRGARIFRVRYEGPGDIDRDGHVDLNDFNRLKAAFGSTGQNIPADLNHDGTVDLADFNTMKRYFGEDYA